MLCTAPTLRTAAISCRIQPSLLTPYHTSSSSSSSPLRANDSSATSKRRISLPKRHVVFKPSSPSSVRLSSTLSSPAPTSSRATTAGSATPTPKLDWNTFFVLRRTRRWYQLGSSIGTSIGGFVGGAQILTRSDMDSIVSQIPLDPFITLGLITFTCGGVGWLLGPVVGTGVFNWRNRRVRKEMDEKEREFYRRIKKWRVDPSASSMANPVPDYYGEKISSVAGYRQWLKDQRAFNKKRTTYVKY